LFGGADSMVSMEPGLLQFYRQQVEPLADTGND
jgi:hypothetical protein